MMKTQTLIERSHLVPHFIAIHQVRQAVMRTIRKAPAHLRPGLQGWGLRVMLFVWQSLALSHICSGLHTA